MVTQQIAGTMISLLVIAWLMPLISAQTTCYNGGYFQHNGEQCQLHCWEDDSVIDISSPQNELTFTSIVESCDEVQTGLRFGYCSNGKSDLVWPDFGPDGCSCPYCKCDTQTSPTMQPFEQPIQKSCYNCFCDNIISGTQMGFQCNYLYSLYQPYNLEAFSCPATATCTDSGNTYYPGQSWFSNVGVGEECNKFCYCDENGSTICETGFSNILSSANSQVKISFLDKCDYSLAGCMDDPTRIFTTKTGPNCDNWCNVNCECPTGVNIGGGWYSESERSNFMWGGGDTLQCSRCECMDGGDYANNAECEPIDNGYLPNSGYTCQESGLNTISCHEQWGNDGESKNIAELNSKVCGSFGPEAWCSWNLYHNTYGNGNINSNDEYWDWGCNDFICVISGIDGECQFSQYNVTYICNGDIITESEIEYTYCCKNSDNCNFQSIDTSICTENTQISNLLQQMHDCASDIFDDGCENYDAEIIDCESVRNFFEYQAECICLAWAGLYQIADEIWKPWIEKQINTFFDSFSAWNEALQCDIVLTCDLTVGGGNVIDAGDTLQPTMTILQPTMITPSPISPSPVTPWPTTTRKPSILINTESNEGMGGYGDIDSTEPVTGTWVFVVLGVAGCCCILAGVIYINTHKHTHIITLISTKIKPKECKVEKIENNIEMNETDYGNVTTTGAFYATPEEPEGNVEWMFGTSQRTNMTQ
eukprot:120783_1